MSSTQTLHNTLTTVPHDPGHIYTDKINIRISLYLKKRKVLGRISRRTKRKRVNKCDITLKVIQTHAIFFLNSMSWDCKQVLNRACCSSNYGINNVITHIIYVSLCPFNTITCIYDTIQYIKTGEMY